MRRLLLLICCFLGLTVYGQSNLTSSPRTFKLPNGVGANDFLPNTVIIKFRDGSSINQIRAATTTLTSNSLNITTADLKDVKQLFKATVQSANWPQQTYDPSSSIGLDRIYEFRFSGSNAIEKVINEILENPIVEYAEPSYIYHTSYIPSDQFYNSSQNYLRQIKADLAWNVIRNSSGIIIAIVDSGSDLDHEDLRPNIILPGKDLVGASYTTMIEDNDPDVKSDSTDHGVRVSGLASAVSDNGIGISSVAFNARLLIVKAGADNNATAIYRGYEGIKYAADNGANIINCSWGGPAGGAYGQDVINYAIAKGCLVIAAAGNEGSIEPEYPAVYQGVMAVTSVDNLDKKSSFSNYGSHVSISAPGETFSTGNRNNYTIARGTSFSVPLVSGTAALVKTRFPNFDMSQVKEQIRVTSDNIDAGNLNFVGLIGKGRLNVFRAVTESPPSVRHQKITLIDKSRGSIPPGDTLRIFFDLKNFLSPVSGLVVRLSSDNPDVQVIDEQVNVSSLGTLQTQAMVGAFRVFIKPGVSDNEDVIFKLTYTAAGGYNDAESFTIRVALDYLNISVNKIGTTISSNGRIGFSGPEGTKGLGFTYMNEQLLFEASLMIGSSPTKVSNNARNDKGGTDEHFVKKVRVGKLEDSQSAFKAQSEFEDSANPSRVNVGVKHTQTAFASAPDDKYTIAEYEIRNTSTATISGLYAGILTDWDVDPSSRDVTRFDPLNRLGMVFPKTGTGKFAGVKLLTSEFAPSYYPMSDQIVGDPSQSGGGLSISEKYESLSSGIKATTLGENTPNGIDVMFVSGYGPLTIPVNGSVKVAFALLAGDNLTDLQASALAAQKKYNEVIQPGPVIPQDDFILEQNSPNPTVGLTTINFSIPEPGMTSIILYSITGQQVRELVNSSLPKGNYTINLDSSGLEAGIYVYRMKFKAKEKALKLIVAK
ncbi:S8 family serine peptidase [Daejeonella lutea]|uniref:Por secretion system C-terminal sorting domain-containing protein n=1 Tax=Daejeonella lutea TaxID=572036 RepID=A0A1T5BGI4_9SPHI|nr:S8 family serine peptidase [Daejeonella lutea]SKB46411.1 Por secretion system C-terminal sorting domain-containing protein [Daejeonella lutea]